MMKPWEFEIKAPEDLPAFLDLLLEWEHPGAEVVRWLVENKKFPVRNNFHASYGSVTWTFHECNPPQDKPFLIPKGKFLSRSWLNDSHNSDSPTELIWRMINCEIYGGKTK